MKQITTSSLGFDVPVTGVPETLDEAATVFGGADKVLDAAITYIRLHRTNTEVREELCDRIEKATSVPRLTKQVKSPTTEDPNRMTEEWDESESEYAKRALASFGKTAAEIAPTVLAGLAVEFKAIGAARTGGPKMAKIYTSAATQLIALGADKFNASITLLEQANPGTTVERDEAGAPKVDSLANALRVNQQRVIAESQKLLGLAA